MRLAYVTALLCLTTTTATKTAAVDALPPNLLALPDGFAFGAATAAYQIEGAASEGGRGPSIWDAFSHEKGKTHDGDSGDVADDHYHRYPEDIELLAKAGIEHYRMSLSWSRLMPDGRTLNEEGVAFYSSLLDLLTEKNIEPRVTLYHWDLPLTLEQEYGGWLSPDVVEDFERGGRRVLLVIAGFTERKKYRTSGDVVPLGPSISSRRGVQGMALSFSN